RRGAGVGDSREGGRAIAQRAAERVLEAGELMSASSDRRIRRARVGRGADVRRLAGGHDAERRRRSEHEGDRDEVEAFHRSDLPVCTLTTVSAAVQAVGYRSAKLRKASAKI